MSRKALLFAAALSLLVTGSSFAAVENIKVSGDITAQLISRDLTADLRPVLGANETNIDRENFLFSQVRLRFDADLTENVSAVLRLISEETWGEDNVDDVEVDLAYVEMQEMLYEPLTVIVGKQNLHYGNGLIIGDPDTNQTSLMAGGLMDNGGRGVANAGDLSLRKSFDAVRAILDYSPYTLDLIFAKVDENRVTEADDVTLWGAYLTYDWDSYNGVTEAYFIAADNSPTYNMLTVATPAENQSKVYTVGTRVQLDPTDKLTVNGEAAWQFGDTLVDYNGTGALVDQSRGGAADRSQHLTAYAFQLGTTYKFLDDKNSQLGFSYTYLSGDDDMADGDMNAWDPLFEDQSPGEILNILGQNSNAHFLQATGSFMPREDVTIGALYAKAILAEKFGADLSSVGPGNEPVFYTTPFGPTAGYAYRVNRDQRDFGDEFDLWGVYDYTEDVQIKLVGGWFFPGAFFSENDSTMYSVRSSVSVSF